MQSGAAYGPSDASRLAELAARQHGPVSIGQLLELGYSRSWVRRRVTAGFLHRRYRGVYLVGHTRLTARGRWMAAVLACSPGAVLSHGAAAALHELRPHPAGPIDVTATSRHAIAGIRCHAVRVLDPRDHTTIDAIPVTTVSRLALDLAETLTAQRLGTTLEAAQRRDGLVLRELDAVIARNPGRHGIRPLRAALGSLRDEAPWTQSELERAFLELVRAAGLPTPHVNVSVAGVVVDFHWPADRLVAEVDGWAFHKTRRAFEADRARDARLIVAGQRVIRFTAARIAGGPGGVAAELSALLRSGAWARSGR